MERQNAKLIVGWSWQTLNRSTNLVSWIAKPVYQRHLLFTFCGDPWNQFDLLSSNCQSFDGFKDSYWASKLILKTLKPRFQGSENISFKWKIIVENYRVSKCFVLMSEFCKIFEASFHTQPCKFYLIEFTLWSVNSQYGMNEGKNMIKGRENDWIKHG